MNRNLYCCQQCGNLKYDWVGNLCPECLEKDRLRKEGKKYFGMPIKMREATKEEKQSVNEYIQSISEKVYTKEEVIAMLTEIQLEILEMKSYESPDGQDLVMLADIGILFQQKINELKGDKR